jgi:hypothetical protein
MSASDSGCEQLYLDDAPGSAWRFSPPDPEHPLFDAGSTMRLLGLSARRDRSAIAGAFALDVSDQGLPAGASESGIVTRSEVESEMTDDVQIHLRLR